MMGGECLLLEGIVVHPTKNILIIQTVLTQVISHRPLRISMIIHLIWPRDIVTRRENTKKIPTMTMATPLDTTIIVRIDRLCLTPTVLRMSMITLHNSFPEPHRHFLVRGQLLLCTHLLRDRPYREAGRRVMIWH